MTSEHREETHSLAADVGASAALFLYSVAVAAGFARVFSGWDWFDNLVAVAFVGHAVALVLRRTRVPIWIAFPITGFALVWLIGFTYYRESYSLLLPTSDTWELFRFDLDVVGESFRSAVAPVPFAGGWDALAAIGIAAAVLLSDTFAFRAYARAEALVPGGVLFVFVAALGTDRDRIASTTALVAAGVVATIVLRYHHAPERVTTVGRARGRLATALPVALGSALSVGLIAGVIGPRLPGADAEPIYETRGGGSGSVTEVTSPLVDIRSRLTNRETTELFTVQANAPSYWRSSALSEFDGTTWRLPDGPLVRADGTIAVERPDSTDIQQEITIAALGGQLLPAAADPIVAQGDADLRFSEVNATILKTSGDLESGDQFSVLSASPQFSAAVLSTATSNDPGDAIYTALPADFPESIRETTLEVTAGATSSFEAARMLHDWMRDPDEFTYSLEVQEGHNNNALESFLQNRIGYCEQFAGAYSAMLRSIGIPSRVAVGFTQGDDDGNGLYSVLGRNAHAWSEVWFDGIGWVPFDPTPTRGAPGATEYTGVEPQQAEGPGDAADADGAAPPASAPAPATTIVPGQLDPSATTVPAVPDLGDQPTGSDVAAATTDDSGGIPWRVLLAVAFVGLVIALPALIRRVRRSAVRSPRSQVAHLWARAIDALETTGLDDAAGRTPAETAVETAHVFPVAARPMQALAEVITYVNYAPDGVDHLDDPGQYGVSLLENCAQWVRQVERAVTDSLGPADRARRYFTHLG
ncbi:transglutaminase TgpA family protein [Ilumatobacter nonamiensis]|uniref:transglutaminase TgpA family protein n=1 Tax=Ilumatobacter nonamiensis TaxID=467093 RepID=UPI00034BDEF8|nr:DUF3488 and transglutaminase-like domain-containing protein [Ilumatobacter nonamiensis]